MTTIKDSGGSPSIKVTRTRIRHGANRVATSVSWSYDATGPDGTKFDNSSIVTLRAVLRHHYGRDIKIIETWRS